MAEQWLYYVSFVIQTENKLGLSAKLVALPHRLDSKETVIALINALTAEVFPDGIPEEFEDSGTLPVTPLSWTLVSAHRGETVEPPKPSSARPRSRRSH